MLASDWVDDARRRLLRLQGKSGAWGYRRTTGPAVEPTALAGLALLATAQDEGAGSGEATTSARWLASIRGRDGSLGVTASLREPGWATPFASMLWGAVGGFAAERRGAVDWLLSTRGVPVPRQAHGPMDHDTTLIGWPWTADTHSWVEPTAAALLVLGREGKWDHPRALEGRRILKDRAIATGGWNYGNPALFGATLRPLPQPTGLALLALARGGDRDGVIRLAVAYLQSTLAETLAPASLGWGILGLRAWGAALEGGDARLRRSFERVASRGGDEVVPLAMLILAAGPGSLRVLDIRPRAENGFA